MSFSSKVKEEILKGFSNSKNCCIIAEKFGEYLTEYKSRKDIQEESYEYKNFFDISKLDECCIKSLLKGAFLGSGCIVDPNLDYHFEISCKSKSCANYLFNLLSLLEFTPKILKRPNSNIYTIYIKESEQISLFLSLIGANSSMLKFEQVRVEKDVKNKVNRANNCETANLAKTIKSSVEQVEAIEKLKKYGAYDRLNEKLKYTIKLRLKYKDESLDYISKKTSGDNYISKSGLKHRLDKIVKLASELENNK